MKGSIMKMNGLRVVALTILISTLAMVAALSRASVAKASRALPLMSITVTNNSGRDMHHLYLSPVDREAWGPDLLNETVLRSGQSFTINDVTCPGLEIKVIAEDREGCFAYGVVSCSQASTGWTLTSDTPKDCGN